MSKKIWKNASNEDSDHDLGWQLGNELSFLKKGESIEIDYDTAMKVRDALLCKTKSAEIKHSQAFDTLREEILQVAIGCTCGDRNESYGEPYDNLSCFADLINMVKKHQRSSHGDVHDLAIQHVLGKLARIICGKPFTKDNYIDAAAYIAIAAECAIIDIQKEPSFEGNTIHTK